MASIIKHRSIEIKCKNILRTIFFYILESETRDPKDFKDTIFFPKFGTYRTYATMYTMPAFRFKLSSIVSHLEPKTKDILANFQPLHL
uniref:Ovule protein n=1 Tax=Steinernema glaseri TaxID=37863 RepID=A0A1I7ZVQ2_9BILA